MVLTSMFRYFLNFIGSSNGVLRTMTSESTYDTNETGIQADLLPRLPHRRLTIHE